MKKVIVFSIFIFVLTTSLFSQGWQNTYPAQNFHPFFIGGANSGEEVRQTSDGGYIMLSTVDLPTGAIRVYMQLIKTDANGQEQWQKIYNFSDVRYDKGTSLILNDDGYLLVGDHGYGGAPSPRPILIQTNLSGDTLWTKTPSLPISETRMIPLENGGYALVGTENFDTQPKFRLAKLNNQGDTTWTKTIAYTANVPGTVYGIEETNDNGLVLAGSALTESFVIKVDSSGNQIWVQSFSFGIGDAFSSIIETPTGELIVSGSAEGFPGHTPFILKLDAQGNTIWINYLPTVGGTSYDQDAVIAPDGNYVGVGRSGNNFNSIYTDSYITKIDTSGNLLWIDYFDTTKTLYLDRLENTSDGGFIVSGTEIGSVAFLQKLDSLGNTLGNLITGTVYNDTNYDCQPTLVEDSLDLWFVKVTGNNNSFYTGLNPNGVFNILVDTGSYQVEVITNNPLWQPCQPTQTATFTTTYDTTVLDFGIQPLIQCPQLEVKLSTPFLRRCFDNNYIVTYQNSGTEPAQNAYIEVEFDPFLVVNSSSLPWSSVNGNLYTFPIGTVGINQSGSFSINVTVDCNAILGQTHCSEAHIYPDSICTITQMWDNVDIDLGVECNPDSVRFEIQNKGTGDMISPLQYYVIEDNLIMRSGTFQLLAGTSQFISVPANGSTYRLEAEQSPTHPQTPLNRPSIQIEGCTTGSSFSTGFVTMYPQNDLMPYIDIDCQKNIGSYDPNDKTGYPLGYDIQNYIEQNQPLEYHIRFQNTGTDTAFNVVIKDILDTTLLDLASLQVGASSHPYRFDLYDGNLLQFTFDNIQLPDSNINEPASHGFVRFTIDQKLNNPIGSTLQNTADIFFDFNTAITTNTTLHTIGKNFILFNIVNTTPIQKENIYVKIFPNPFMESARFEVEGEFSDLTFIVTDALGRVVEERSVASEFIFERQNLPSGTYFYSILHQGALINSGKIMIMK